MPDPTSCRRNDRLRGVLDTAAGRTVQAYTEFMKTFATGKLSQAAAKYGDNAPMAAVCCNACRTCVQTNLIGLTLAALVGAGAWVTKLVRRDKPA